MSVKGQNTKSIRKKSLPNTRNPVRGVKNIKFHHKTSAGETVIDLTNLVVPAGLTNPSPAELLKARLKDFEENLVKFTSSVKGELMDGQNLAFTIVSNTTIKLHFEAEEGEIFTGIFSGAVTNGTLIGDVRTPGGSGALLEGQTDFNLGEAVPIENLSNDWPIQLFRGNNGRPMLRNTLNGTSGGNYQMIDRGDGYCQVIRFNIAGDVGDEPVMWASHGALGERPNLSVLDRVDKINGQFEVMLQDLSLVTGFPESKYRDTVPTPSDIKAHGDRVLANETRSVDNTRSFDPTKLTDQEATKLGHKEYNHGDAGLTVSNDAGGETINHGIFVPYQLQNGSWRLRFNIGMTHNSSSNYSVSITGVTFKDNVSLQQVGGSATSAANTMKALASDDSGTITITTSSNSTVTRLSGDVALEEKPTWAA